MWKLYRHRRDYSVIYEVRESDGYVEFRQLGSERALGSAPKEEWQQIYEPVPEEE